MRFLRLCRRGYTSSAPVQARLFSLGAQEEGQDTFSATMGLAAGRTFTLAAQEAGSDTFSGSLLTGRVFTLAAQESGSDTFSATITSGRVFSLAAQEAGSDTFSATLERGRIFSMAAQESGSDTFSGTFTTSPASVNPVISMATFTNTEDGTRDSLAVTGTYAGADTIDATLEFYEGLTLRATATVLGVTVTTGNFNFSENIDPGDLTYDGASTAADMPNVDNIDVTIAERTNGGTATTNVTGVSGLDVVAPTFSSAEIGTVDATSLIVTFSEAMRGSTTAADWDVQVNASPATESAVAFTPGGTTADITLGAAVSNGDTVTIAYNGTGLTDEDGNALATFTAQSVTNNVAASPTVPDAFVDANWSVATGSGANELDVTIASLPSDGGATITDVQYDVDGGGSWTSLPSYAGTGTYTITMAAASTSYAIRLRAVNSVGNAAAGNSESATSGAAASSAMASDASAIRSHVPSTVQHTSGVITAWNDQSGNAYHLAQVASVPLPSYDTVNDRVQFDGTELIGDASFAYANSERAVLDGGGSITKFMVVQHTQIPDTTFDPRVMAVDGSTDGGNKIDQIAYFQAGGGTPTARFDAFHRGFSDAAFVDAPNPADATFLGALVAIRVQINQTNITITVTDGVTTETNTASVTAANFAISGDGFYIGGSYSTAPALQEAMIGDVVLYHSTTAADTSAIWTEVQTFL